MIKKMSQICIDGQHLDCRNTECECKCHLSMSLQDEEEVRRLRRLEYIKGILERDEERIKEDLK